MHCKVEKILVYLISISPDTLSSDELCSVNIAPCVQMMFIGNKNNLIN